MTIKHQIKKALHQLPYIEKKVQYLRHGKNTLHESRDAAQSNGMYPPGHYHSPIPSLQEIKKHENRLFNRQKKIIAGVDLREEAQVRLLEDLAKHYADLPFQDLKNEEGRYYFRNDCYSYADAIYLYSLIRHLRPKKIIEVGSGFSSAVTLDTNELFFNNEINCIFIEPYPERLLSLLKQGDHERCQIIKKDLQEIPLDTFRELQKNDILFIDSTHVSKIGSDVNYYLFEILPCLAPGVVIHIHDIFYPFEYPSEWVYKGIAWNEDYIIRAFLQYNKQFQIMLFGNYIGLFQENWLREHMPRCLENIGGSLWLKKV
ncbi:MAG: class I SAM-dependent methyltransferase [Patescibacteria group bacterium]|jgi:predicted O-methyltransferase YrrM